MKRITIPLESGISLSALEGGDGQPFMMIPGWSQPTNEWTVNAEAITSCRRVIASDIRGHGESDTPGYGHRVYRLAKPCMKFYSIWLYHLSVLWGTRWVVQLYGHILIFTVQAR